jgi:hypothetical protein
VIFEDAVHRKTKRPQDNFVAANRIIGSIESIFRTVGLVLTGDSRLELVAGAFGGGMSGCADNGHRGSPPPKFSFDAGSSEKLLRSLTLPARCGAARGVCVWAKIRDKHDPLEGPGEQSSFDWQLKEFSRR